MSISRLEYRRKSTGELLDMYLFDNRFPFSPRFPGGVADDPDDIEVTVDGEPAERFGHVC